MDRQTIAEHLAQAERQVAEGQTHIERQRAIIAELQQNGRDTYLANKLLDTFVDLEAAHVAGRDRLCRELAKVDSERLRDHAERARRLARYVTDRRIRIVLELLAEEVEKKIAEIERN